MSASPNNTSPTPMSKPGSSGKVINDCDLLNEVDDMMRKKLVELESDGANHEELNTAADDYGRILDLLDARILGEKSNETAAFKRHAFAFLEERFYEKIAIIYEPEYQVSPEQAEKIVAMTRQKIQRIEKILLSIESNS